MKFIVAFILTVIFSFSIYAQKQAEVVVTSTHIRKSPDINSEKVQTIQKGEKVVLEKSRDTNGWFYVSTLDGNVKGWIRRDTIRSITNAETVNQTSQKNNQPPQKSDKESRKKDKEPQKNDKEPQKVVQKSTSPSNSVSVNTPVANNNSLPNSTPVSSEKQSSVSAPGDAAPETPVTIEDNEVLRIDTEEVSLNVRVVDANNRPVRNLDQTHFKIYEDDVLQPITSLTTAEVPAVNALVIDNSRSLRSQLQKVIEAGKIIIGTNRPKDETAVVRFVSSNKIEVVQDFTTNKNSLGNALDNLYVEGGQTAIIDAVFQTAKKIERYQNTGKNDDVKLRALILVSDGDDRGSSHSEQELFKLLRESNVQIYAVGFINDLSSQPNASADDRRGKAKSFLTRLAQETGGKVYFPNSIEELSQIASDISGEMRTQYLISYAPTNDNRDGTFRKIKVEIADGANNEKRTAITRTGRNSLPK